jgi:two-component system response regulator FixJ
MSEKTGEASETTRAIAERSQAAEAWRRIGTKTNNPCAASSRPARQTVYIVDDDPAVIVTLTALFGAAGIFALGYHSATAFLSKYSPLSPGCLLADVNMPGMTGLDLQERLIALGICLPVIMITGAANIATAVQAMKRGAIDFIQKPFEPDVIVGTVRRALTLDVQLNAQRVSALMISGRLSMLTHRERTILEIVADGHATKTVAQALGISPRTVDAHRANILKKLNVKSVADLIRTVLPLRLPPAI